MNKYTETRESRAAHQENPYHKMHSSGCVTTAYYKDIEY